MTRDQLIRGTWDAKRTKGSSRYNQFSHCGLSLKSSRVPPWVLAVFLLVIETGEC